MNTFEAIASACRRAPDRERLTYLHDDDRIETVSGGDLIRRACDLSAGLQSVGSPGDRVLLAYPAGIDFVVGFLGCLAAERIPVPVSYPKPRRPLSRYQTVADDSQAAVALTSDTMLSLIDPLTLSSVRWYSEQLFLQDQGIQPASSHHAFRSNSNASHQPAFLQYTSGSTSEPKGVMVTHGNLLANLEAIREGFQIDQRPPDERIVCSWLPAYHDMGLIGVILASLTHDGHSVLMSPTAFLQRPARWLSAISHYAARVTVAPCFGYQWATEKVTDAEIADLDLSRLDLAACGAEPIAAGVLERFTDRFAPAGFRHEAFYPCYGLAESTLMVTGTDRGDAGGNRQIDGSINGDETFSGLPGPVTATISRNKLRDHSAASPTSSDDAMVVVSCGVPVRETTLKIVDPKCERILGENEIGEIRVHSASVAAGYWSDSETSDFVFRSSIGEDSKTFLRTGDLGFTRKGQLYVTGRIKDLIIIGGQNHYPQDIERTVGQSHPVLGAASGAAFSVSDDTSERLIVVHEVSRDYNESQREEILRAVRTAIAYGHDLAVHEVVLIRLASLPRTSSGKVRRHQCRQWFEADQLKRVAQWRQDHAIDSAIFPDLSRLIRGGHAGPLVRQKIQSALLDWLARNTDAPVEDIRPDQSFAESGVDSLMAVELSQQLEQWLDIRLSPVAAWSYPNPESLSEHLAALATGKPDPAPTEDSSSELEVLLAEIESLDDDSVNELLRHTAGGPVEFVESEAITSSDELGH